MSATRLRMERSTRAEALGDGTVAAPDVGRLDSTWLACHRGTRQGRRNARPLVALSPTIVLTRTASEANQL